jgi:hypothetical protein
VRLRITASGRRVHNRLLAARDDTVDGLMRTLEPSVVQRLAEMGAPALSATDTLRHLCHLRHLRQRRACTRCPVSAGLRADGAIRAGRHREVKSGRVDDAWAPVFSSRNARVRQKPWRPKRWRWLVGRGRGVASWFQDRPWSRRCVRLRAAAIRRWADGRDA